MTDQLQTRKLKGSLFSTNPWMLILVIFPLPILILGFLFYYWSSARADYQRISSQFIQRQNKVLAYDAMEIAREVSHLFEQLAQDVQALALIPVSASHFTKFYLSRVGQVTQVDTRDDSASTIPLPLYNEIIFLNLSGDEQLRFRNGQREKTIRRLSQCSGKNLCDPDLIRKGISLSEGELYFGKVVRWYSAAQEQEKLEGAYLPVVYRASDGLFLLGLDYRYLKELLSQPSFPYDRKQNLLQAYQNGNYIYIVDSEYDFIAHPKFWNVTGFSQDSGLRVPPMRLDADEGKHPINIRSYQGERLKDYFDRLLNRSFLQRTVDIFEAANLGGSNRVLSVAPILLQKGQYRANGIFGYVVLGCSVENFEAPKEQYSPYY